MSCKVTIKGYVNKPETKTSKGGKTYASYSVRAKTGKTQSGTPFYTYFNCRDMNNAAPEDGSFVTIEGGLTIYDYDHKASGEKRKGFDVFVDSVEVAPPREGSGPGTPQAKGETDLSWMDGE